MSIGDESFEHEVGRGVGHGDRRSLGSAETAEPLTASTGATRGSTISKPPLASAKGSRVYVGQSRRVFGETGSDTLATRG